MSAQFSVRDGKAWKTRFLTIWGGQALSMLGSQLVQFSLIWYLTAATGSATVLAAASMAGMLPTVILGPIAGTLVDRWDRRRVMILADSLISLATLVLSLLFLFEAAAFWHIYVLMFLRALAGCFHGSAMSASTSLMVPVEHLTRIQGINQMLNGGLNIIAAPLGAVLLGLLPLQGILAIDVVTALAAVVTLAVVSIPQPERAESGSRAGREMPDFWEDFSAGFQYLTAKPGLWIIGLMAVGINVTIIPAFSLLPLLVQDYFGGGAAQLGWIESAMGIGVFAGGGLLGAWGGFRRKVLTSMIGLMGMGAGALVVALTPASHFSLAVAGVFLVGFLNPITMGPIFAVVQSTVEPEMQARILSLLTSIGAGMAPVGLLAAGPLADQFGIQTWFLIGGAVCVVMALVGLSLPPVMNLEGKRVHDREKPRWSSAPVFLGRAQGSAEEGKAPFPGAESGKRLVV